MANYYTNIAFDLDVTPAEAERLNIVALYDWEAKFDDNDDDTTDPIQPELAAILGVTSKAEAIKLLGFSDPDYPYLSCDIDVTGERVLITASEGPDLEALAKVLQVSLDESLPIGFEWSNDCDKHRAGAFGGGCCAIFKDRVEFKNTSTMLAEMLGG